MLVNKTDRVTLPDNEHVNEYFSQTRNSSNRRQIVHKHFLFLIFMSGFDGVDIRWSKISSKHEHNQRLKFFAESVKIVGARILN